MVWNHLAYLLNPITIPAYPGNWIISPRISFKWFGVEAETVRAYILFAKLGCLRDSEGGCIQYLN